MNLPLAPGGTEPELTKPTIYGPRRYPENAIMRTASAMSNSAVWIAQRSMEVMKLIVHEFRFQKRGAGWKEGFYVLLTNLAENTRKTA